MSIKEFISNSLINFSNSISKVFVQKADVVDNLTSTDTDKPLSANQGSTLSATDVSLQTQINTLNSNMVSYKKCTIAAGGTKRVLVRDPEVTGNLVLFSTFFVLPSYKTIFFASSGNGNNTNSGQNITITKLLESSVVTVAPVNESGSYNCFDITNNGSYNVTLHANTFYGAPPVFYDV